jgi:Ca-activated chloride channel family protein
MRTIYFCGLLILTAIVAFTPFNNFTVKGKVSDQLGNPLVQVTITEKGTRNATLTGNNGEFSLTVRSAHASLIFESPGFSNKEITLQGQSFLSVQLDIPSKKLEEVVVTGRGTRNNKRLMAISDNRLNSYRPMPVEDALMGKVSGLDITNHSKLRSKNYPGSAQPGKYHDSIDEAFNTEGYDGIVENRFLKVTDNPLSTFSIDVDAASYSNVRRFLNDGALPPAGAVRIEEMINYFHYDYPQPTGEDPFSINTEIAACPWSQDNRLVLIGLQGKQIPTENLTPSNIVFLIDVSGSMNEPNKLPLVQQSMKMLTEQLREQDRVAIVVYAGNAGLVLPATSGANKQAISNAIDRLEAGGSTAGGAGIKLAYEIAKNNYLPKGNNRVILCTDGDFNVGASSDDEMERLIEQERKSGVFLTVLGYGMGNYKDSKMQKLADKGNGNHAYIDNLNEAKKVLVSEFGGTLFTIAKDVKLQIEFNPEKVQAYRLIGYENRLLNKEDFNNDQKDAGELGSGHTVTALYEVIPAGVKSRFIETVDPLKYQPMRENNERTASSELMTIKFRYKRPDGNTSKLIEHPVQDNPCNISKSSENLRFASAVAEFGMLLRQSEFKQNSSFSSVISLARESLGGDAEGYRKEFLQLVQKAGKLAKSGIENPDKDEEFLGRK